MGGQQFRFGKPCLRCELYELFKCKRIWHPEISRIRVVFNDQQLTTRFEEGAHMLQYFDPVLEEVQRVRHDDAIQKRKAQRAGKILRKQMQVGVKWETRAIGAFQFFQGGAILIDRMDDSIRADQLAQGEGERAATRAEICPVATERQVRRLEQVNMICMVHAQNYKRWNSMGQPDKRLGQVEYLHAVA
jgi:hypothetical protein